jgi:hypothetical protein
MILVMTNRLFLRTGTSQHPPNDVHLRGSKRIKRPKNFPKPGKECQKGEIINLDMLVQCYFTILSAVTDNMLLLVEETF